MTKPRIFLSYSRRDAAFVDRLDVGLKARGFETLIDRTEIYAFEEWWKRIEVLIRQSDSVVFVLSPDSLASSVAQKEISFAASLNKRFAPIVYRPVASMSVPDALARLNFLPFTEEDAFEEKCDNLANALQTDISWIRKHTEFGELAGRWAASGRPGPKGLLLRSPLLEEGEHWISSRPEGAPLPTNDTVAFITASRRAATQRRNRISLALGAGLAVSIALGGLALWQARLATERGTIAETQRGLAESRLNRALITESRFLADLANQQTNRGDATSAMLLALDALPSKEQPRPYVAEAEQSLLLARNHFRENVVLKGHEGSVQSVAFNQSGDRLLTSSRDGTLRVWDPSTGSQTLVAKSDSVIDYAMFSSDGTQILAVSKAGSATVRSAVDGAEIFRLDGGGVFAFDTTGKFLLRGTTDSVSWIATDTGRVAKTRPLRRLAAQLKGLIRGRSVVISPDGTRLAIGYFPEAFVPAFGGETHLLWDVVNDRFVDLQDSSDGMRLSRLNRLSFSPDGKLILGTTALGKMKVWDAVSGKLKFEPDQFCESARVSSLSQDGKQVVAACSDGSIRVYDFEKANSVLEVFQAHSEIVSVAVHPTAGLLVGGTWNGLVSVWSFAARHPRTPRRLDYEGEQALFLPGGTRVAIVGRARMLRVRDATTGTELGSSFELDRQEVIRAVGREGTTILTTDPNGKIRLRSLADGAELRAITRSGKTVMKAFLSGDGERATVVYSDYKIGVESLTDDRQIGLFDPGGNKFLSASADGSASRVVLVGKDAIAIIDATDGRLLSSWWPEPGERKIQNITGALSVDGQFAWIGSESSIEIWDVLNREKLSTLPLKISEISDAKMNRRKSRALIAFGENNKIAVWDTTEGRAIEEKNIGELDPVMAIVERVQAVSMSADETRILVVGPGGVSIWDQFADYEAAVRDGRDLVPRCLTLTQRENFFLEQSPPSWCVSLRKWPYDTEEWQEVLRKN
jgi:WD40 repeat protein